MAGNLTCKSFTDFLIRRTEHLDADIIKDITPTDGWIGHVSTGRFPALDGVSHTFDRINRVFPNLSGCWTDVQAGNCLGTPCDPDAKEIGMGYTRDSYKLQTKAYKTQLFCFDLIMSADRAKEQFAGLVSSLKDATNIIMSDRMRTEALRIAGKKVLAGAAMDDFTYTWNDDCTILTPSALPTSKLTMQMLQRQIEPLKFNGYLGANPGMPPVFEYVTDMIQGFNFAQGNSELNQFFRFSDFAPGGVLYKYGYSNGVGNFVFRYDSMPLRFQDIGGGQLQRVFPYYNTDATQGIKGVVNDAYINAEYQIDFIWNRQSMMSMVADTTQINPMMPFASRDFGGKWMFAQNNLGATDDGCVIDNSYGNKGRFQTMFKLATKAVRPEWAVAILYKREIACVVDVAPCAPTPSYVLQDYSSANDACPNPTIDFDLTDVTGPYQINAAAGGSEITCNGVPVSHTASGSLASYQAIADYLNGATGAPHLGTWSATTTGIALDGSTCVSVTVTVVSA